VFSTSNPYLQLSIRTSAFPHLMTNMLSDVPRVRVRGRHKEALAVLAKGLSCPHRISRNALRLVPNVSRVRVLAAG
jgi:hypothetical protein